MTQKQLDLLSDRELEIERSVENIHGLMQDKPDFIDAEGFFDEYIEIHKTYAAHAANNPEALKRAIFIQWYSCSEPSANTGIPGGGGPFDSEQHLDRDTEIYILKLLDRMIAREQLDEELKWMLCYYGIWNEYFEYFPEFKEMHHLKRFVSDNGRYPYPKNPDKGKFQSRGQMGSYWAGFGFR